MQPELTTWHHVFIGACRHGHNYVEAERLADLAVSGNYQPETAAPAPKLTTPDGSHLLGRWTRDGKAKAVRILSLCQHGMDFCIKLSNGSSWNYYNDGRWGSGISEYDLIPTEAPAPKLTTPDGSHLLGRKTKRGDRMVVKVLRIENGQSWRCIFDDGTEASYNDDGTYYNNNPCSADLLPPAPCQAHEDSNSDPLLTKWQDRDGNGNPVTLLAVVHPCNTDPRIVGYMGHAICMPACWNLRGDRINSPCGEVVGNLIPKPGHE